VKHFSNEPCTKELLDLLADHLALLVIEAAKALLYRF
jgi:hypothetical protein